MGYEFLNEVFGHYSHANVLQRDWCIASEVVSAASRGPMCAR